MPVLELQCRFVGAQEIFFFFFEEFIYLSERESEHNKQGEQQREKEAGGESVFPLSKEPNSGLDPRALGS